MKGQEEEGGQPPVFTHRVTWILPEYNYRAIQEHHKAVNQEFGLPFIEGHRGAKRRYMRTAGVVSSDMNSYMLNYYFQNPHDAILFSLKYVR